MITYCISTMGGTWDRGIPSEDVAISIAIDQNLYGDYSYGCTDALVRREVRVVREPYDGDEVERPNVYIRFHEDEDEFEREEFVRINPETRRDCCGSFPGHRGR